MRKLGKAPLSRKASANKDMSLRSMHLWRLANRQSLTISIYGYGQQVYLGYYGRGNYGRGYYNRGHYGYGCHGLGGFQYGCRYW